MNTNSRMSAIDDRRGVSVKKEPEKRSTTVITWLVCFFIALFIWLYVMETNPPQYTETFDDVDVIVELTDTQSYFYKITSVSGDVIDVKLKGDKKSLSLCNEDTIIAYADVANINAAGTYVCNVIFVLPEGAALSGGSAYTVTLVVEDVE